MKYLVTFHKLETLLTNINYFSFVNWGIVNKFFHLNIALMCLTLLELPDYMDGLHSIATPLHSMHTH